ncbi:hypothetical protein EHW67_08560 [Arenibacter aquaticus]|uniref:beta-N-acetylhexosaminidase n=1 Tax=Arenibacter aquaticus TaxID=2489054 RepID=A0A3S0C7S4_9FLAO|nr:family 20 glycosylhydrolase [Arenibacter aquaticus]RTE53975.1 hypothetical protein EHW67_08560 [Arenibacter aquaticus]
MRIRDLFYGFASVSIILLTSCSSVSKSLEVTEDREVSVIPTPKKWDNQNGNFRFSDRTAIVVEDDSLLPIARILSAYATRLTGNNIDFVTSAPNKNTIVIKYNSGLEPNTHKISVGDNIILEGSSYNTIANGAATMVQLIKSNETGSYIPNVSITDYASSEFRAVLLDVARFWHPVETLKETIDLLWMYKIPYLQLHLSDNNRFTFPLKNYPKLNKINTQGEREFYTKEELAKLVEYAKERGVVIIPEVDLPGHSAMLWNTYPEVFGSLDPQTNKPEPLYVVNIAKEETYRGVNEIIEELAATFYNSPFIHVGGDEVYLENLKKVPEYLPYTQANGLTAAANGDANELFAHFINKMNQMVKATGKSTILWEGFHGTGGGNVTIDKDITVIVWNTTYNHPDNLLKNGYKVINSTWIPWYMVGAMNLAPSLERAYNWDITNWSHWKNEIKDVTVGSKENIVGAQISFWEQNHYKVIPVLRERVPILAEHLWNKKPTKDFEAFKLDLKSTNSTYGRLFRPVVTKVNNLIQQQDLKFTDTAEVVLEEQPKARYKWVFSKSWDLPDMKNAKFYEEPIVLSESGVLTIQKEDLNGNTIGYPVQEYYQKIEPAYRYKIYGPAPAKGWDSMPNFSDLNLIREGISGKVTEDRLDKINGELFAKVRKEGHVDTRFKDVYNPYGLELTGEILTEEGDYQLRLTTDDGLAEVYIDGILVAKGTEFKRKPEEYSVSLSEGKHSLMIKYFYKHIQNQLNIMYKKEGETNFVPLEELVMPLSN